MFKKILVPTDGSSLSEKCIQAAVKFAASLDAKMVAISVIDPYIPVPPIIDGIPLDPNFYDEDTRRIFEAQPQQLAKKNVSFAHDVARSAGVNCEMVTATSENPYEEIVKAVNTFNCDLIFMASHGRKGLNRLILGSETQKVLAYSSVPVLVYR